MKRYHIGVICENKFEFHRMMLEMNVGTILKLEGHATTATKRTTFLCIDSIERTRGLRLDDLIVMPELIDSDIHRAAEYRLMEP